MNTQHKTKFLGLALGASLFLAACGGGGSSNTNSAADNNHPRAKDPEVYIHQLADPEKLNPLTSTDASSQYIQRYLFSSLLEYDLNTLDLIPQLAVARPEIKEINEGEFAGGMSLTYEIHPEATWDNGSPVTAEDYIFTVKALKNPKVMSNPLKPYFEFIKKIEVDPKNPKRFTIYSKDRYFMAEQNTGGLYLMPQYFYDAEKLTNKFSIEQLSDPSKTKQLEADPDIERFAKNFNEQYDRKDLIGSGPYKFVEWASKQKIVLEKKQNWWGDKVKDQKNLAAYPPKLVYRIVSDWEGAISEAKNQNLDILYSLPPEKFSELKTNTSFTSLYDMSTPLSYSYIYLGFNMKSDLFKDRLLRQAFSHIVDYKEIISVLYEDMAERTIGPIHPSKAHYNKSLPLKEHDLEKAKALLSEAGWKDSDGDGLLDKVINGKKTPLRVNYKYNSENSIRKNIGILLQSQAKPLGIEVVLDGKEWSQFLKETKNRNFDMICLGWSQSPGLDEMKQIWHTSSDTPDGSNYTGFGNKETDKIIDSIRITLDPAKRQELYNRMQEIIYNEQPYVFLAVPKERIAIHKRFDNVVTTSVRPGFKESQFKLK